MYEYCITNGSTDYIYLCFYCPAILLIMMYIVKYAVVHHLPSFMYIKEESF